MTEKTSIPRPLPDIRISSLCCAECGRRLLEVRDDPNQLWHDLRCPNCDRDLLEMGLVGHA